MEELGYVDGILEELGSRVQGSESDGYSAAPGEIQYSMDSEIWELIFFEVYYLKPSSAEGCMPLVKFW